MSALSVSVIIPLHNGERHIAEAIASVLAQTRPVDECIVVDDGSTDASGRIARAARGVRYVFQPNAGVAVARNTGLGLARGDCVAFLDQDDLMEPEKMACQVAALEADPALGYALVHERIVHEDGEAHPEWLHAHAKDEHLLSYVPSSWLVRRRALARVGVFNVSYVSGSDTDWLLRARELGVRHAAVSRTLLVRRVHEANNSHQTDVLRADFLRALRESARRRRAGAQP